MNRLNFSNINRHFDQSAAEWRNLIPRHSRAGGKLNRHCEDDEGGRGNLIRREQNKMRLPRRVASAPLLAMTSTIIKKQ